MQTIDLAGWGGLLAGVAALATALHSCQQTDAVSQHANAISQGSETISISAAEDRDKLEALTRSVSDLNNTVNGALVAENEGIRDNAKALEELSRELVRIAKTAAPGAPPPVLRARPANPDAGVMTRITVPPATSMPFPLWSAAKSAIERK